MPNSHTVQGLSVYCAMQILNGNIKAFNLYAESPNLHNSYFTYITMYFVLIGIAKTGHKTKLFLLHFLVQIYSIHTHYL